MTNRSLCEVSVIAELALGRLLYLLSEVSPQAVWLISVWDPLRTTFLHWLPCMLHAPPFLLWLYLLCAYFSIGGREPQIPGTPLQNIIQVPLQKDLHWKYSPNTCRALHFISTWYIIGSFKVTLLFYLLNDEPHRRTIQGQRQLLTGDFFALLSSSITSFILFLYYSNHSWCYL